LRFQRDHHHRIAIRRAIQRQTRTSAFESKYPVKKDAADLMVWSHVVFVQIDSFKLTKNIVAWSGELIRW
jgi:hypothetical protein